jgi:hypothetical protein
MKKIILFSLLTLIIGGCKREELVSKSTPAHIEAEHAASKITQTLDDCSCLPNGANSCGGLGNYNVINQFMGGQGTLYKTITWNNCLTSPYLADPGCNDPLNNITSQLKLCWRSCTSVTAEFTGKPNCLPCFPNHFCIALNASEYTDASGHHYLLTGNYNGDIQSNVEIVIIISADPDITVRCTTNPNNPSTLVRYTCYGNF